MLSKIFIFAAPFALAQSTDEVMTLLSAEDSLSQFDSAMQLAAS